MKQCVLLLTIVAFFITSCGDDPKKKLDHHDKTLAKFHTKRNPGKWKKQADKHDPQITVKKKNKKYHIDVVVPFVASRAPLHYAEVILLLDHNHKELQKVKFDKWTKVASTTFILPGDYKSYLYVVIKCNLHDMWKKRVDLQ